MGNGCVHIRAALLCLGVGAAFVGAGVARADDWSSWGLDAHRSRLSAEKSGPDFAAASWEHRWGQTDQPAYRALLASPAVADGFVVFATQRNMLGALREADGRLL